MKRIKELMPRVVVTIGRDGSVENSAYNSVHYETTRFLDTIRSNEGLRTVLSRSDTPETMVLSIGFTEHEAAKAIERELVKRISTACSKLGIKSVKTAMDSGKRKGNCNMEKTSSVFRALVEMGVIPEGMIAGDIRWQAVFFIGPAGSGKTHIRDLRYLRHLDFKVVDPDAIKQTHPEYDPQAPHKLHEWSKEIAEGMYDRIISDGQGTPVIVDGTGRNVSYVLSKMERAKGNGYNTYIVYVPFEVSVFRNRNRSRFVPEEALMEQSVKIKKNFSILKSHADQARVIPNFENAEYEKAKKDVELYPVPQSSRPPRPGEEGYGLPVSSSGREARIAMALLKLARRLCS